MGKAGSKAAKATKKLAGKKLAGKLADAEAAASHRAARYREHPVARTAGLLAEMADQPQLIVTALGTIGAGIATRRADLTRGGARMLAAHLVATAVKSAIKHQVDRSRPKHELAGARTTLRGGHSRDHELSSFPSGHTAGAVAAARAVSRDVEGAALPATLAVGAVAATQPATGSHHLSDVVAGAVIGWLAEALVSAVFDRVEPMVEHAFAAGRDRDPALP